MLTKIRIVVSEKQGLYRKSLANLLKTNPDLEVVAEAENGRDLLELLKHTRINIILLDSELPDMECKTTLEIIKRRFPETKVIVLSIHATPELMSDYLTSGASGHICKNCSVENLFSAIQSVENEGYYFDNSVSKALLESVIKKNQPPVPLSEIIFNEREKDIMKKICDGKTNKEIANSLYLSTSTIDFYKTKIYGKTKCKNVASLLCFALKNGIIALT